MKVAKGDRDSAMALSPGDSVGDENPYRSPRALGMNRTGQIKVWKQGVRSQLVASGVLLRRVVIEAPFDCTVEFNGRGLRDVIRVDDQIVAASISWWRITPRLDFLISTTLDEDIPVTVYVELSTMLRMRNFRIQIGEMVVYDERADKRILAPVTQ